MCVSGCFPPPFMFNSLHGFDLYTTYVCSAPGRFYLTSVKHTYEMGTSELHRNSIMLAASALTTNRSMYPKDLNRRP